MDLFFKNPGYFFETYFSFSAIGFFIALIVSFIALLFLCRGRFKKKSSLIVYVLFSSIYLAGLIGITLMNVNRGEVQASHLNPLFNVQDMFGEQGVHQIRGCLSNVILFIPFGALAAVFFKNHKFLYTLVASAVLSIVIEVLQFVLRRGCAETMDVICNVLGGIIGAAIMILIIKIKDYFIKRYKE